MGSAAIGLTQPAGHGQLVSVLDRKNLEWELYHDVWDQLDLLYEGGARLKNNGTNFLIKRPKELYDVYQERYRRITYQNLLQNCIGWYLAKMFEREPRIDFDSKKPSAQGGTKSSASANGKSAKKTSPTLLNQPAQDERWTKFLDNCDRGETTFVDFARGMLETAMLYRRCFVLIDTAQGSDIPIQTQADVKAAGLDQPYLVSYSPQNIFNWSVDQYGNLNWIVIKTIEVTQDDPLGKLEYSAHWWIFDRKKFQHYKYVSAKDVSANTAVFFNRTGETIGDANARAELVLEDTHALSNFNQVPIKVFQLPMNLWFSSRSYLHLLEHFDQLNSYAWKLFVANHPQLVIQSKREIGGITNSEVSFISLDPEDKIFYLEPDGKSFVESRLYLQLMREEIYRGFHLQAQAKTSTATADGASGYSKEMEMAPAIDVLNSLGDLLRAGQQKILLAYKQAAGMKYDKAEDLPDVNGYNFETKPALQDITILQATIDTGVLDKSPTLEKVLDKKVGLAIADGENQATKDQIIEEIETAPVRKEVADQKEADQQASFEKQFDRATSKEVLNAEQASVAA